MDNPKITIIKKGDIPHQKATKNSRKRRGKCSNSSSLEYYFPPESNLGDFCFGQSPKANVSKILWLFVFEIGNSIVVG